MTQNNSANTKIALITGANRGIGLEITRQLAHQGIIVYLAARNIEDAKKAAITVKSSKTDIRPVQLDVSNEEEIQDVFALLQENHGRLDILVNNSGVFLEGEFGISSETFRQSFEVNAIAPYILTHYMTPLLQKSAGGRVVNQSSMMGSMTLMSANPQPESPAYCASKAALNMVTITQAAALAPHKIKVNACHPGWVKTRMGGSEAQISVEEGAKSAIHLALLPDDGPTGGFFHGDGAMPW